MRWIPLDRVQELERVIAQQITYGGWTARRDAMAVALGLHGLRVGEVSRARLADLFAAGCVLHVPGFKRGNARDIRLHLSLVRSLIEWREGHVSELLLFTRAGRRVHPTHLRRAAARLVHLAIDERLRFHALRHTFAMRLYRDSDHDLSLVQQKLGHRSIKSTEVYARSLADVPDVSLVRVDQLEPSQPPLRIYCPAG